MRVERAAEEEPPSGRAASSGPASAATSPRACGQPHSCCGAHLCSCKRMGAGGAQRFGNEAQHGSSLCKGLELSPGLLTSLASVSAASRTAYTPPLCQRDPFGLVRIGAALRLSYGGRPGSRASRGAWRARAGLAVAPGRGGVGSHACADCRLPLHSFAQTHCPTPVLLQNILGLAVAALFIAYNYFTAEVPRAQE